MAIYNYYEEHERAARERMQYQQQYNGYTTSIGTTYINGSFNMSSLSTLCATVRDEKPTINKKLLLLK